ncbi:Protein N-lysine methyltransferase METTL21A [Ananas comosus]|uniref:Protein N-lysine methyltransferase METTL21A n=1 Tax=Ananas comosus TaxID=4615 RepID=A0A199V4K7_ANACO|nr:Protein N-lysine methyltransferase METTL21A [Ananas comosus]
MQIEGEIDEDDTICIDSSFFVDRSYELTTFTFGSHVLQLFCLRSASTDYDLTGQLVWPGAVLLNNFLSLHAEILEGRSVIELGSGVGITGILCSRLCREVVLTDHNEEIIKKNIELQSSLGNPGSTGLKAEKLEWGNVDQISQILERHPRGFDLILGADIYILFISFLLYCLLRPFIFSSVPPLFDTVEKLLRTQGSKCRFILAYISRAKNMDTVIVDEAVQRGMRIDEVDGTRTTVANLEGVIFEITLK